MPKGLGLVLMGCSIRSRGVCVGETVMLGVGETVAVEVAVGVRVIVGLGLAVGVILGVPVGDGVAVEGVAKWTSSI